MPEMQLPPEIIQPDDSDPTLGGLGGSWTLFAFGPADLPVVVQSPTPLTASFSADGVAGFAGCNNYRGGFTYDNGTISTGPFAATRLACEPAIMELEMGYLRAMEQAQSYAIEGDQLTIVYAEGILIFNRLQSE